MRNVHRICVWKPNVCIVLSLLVISVWAASVVCKCSWSMRTADNHWGLNCQCAHCRADCVLLGICTQCTCSLIDMAFGVLVTVLICPLYSPVVTICTAQWSLYVPHSGHYMYRTVVTICTSHWSLYVPHSGHYIYRTLVTIINAQLSQDVPHSVQYMYRTVVIICTA
jgi:hypothetical protein